MVELILRYGPNLEATDFNCVTALDLSCAGWIGNMDEPYPEGMLGSLHCSYILC